MSRSGFGRSLSGSVAGVLLAGAALAQPPTPRPAPCPPEWRGLLGLYGGGDSVLLVLERDGALEAMVKGGRFYALETLGNDRFRFPNVGRLAARNVVFSRDASGRAASLRLDEALLPRDPSSDGSVLRLTPVRSLDEVIRSARTASPPAEPAPPLASDLLDLTRLDATIRVDLRYAGDDNEVGRHLLESSRALLQRPAAEALVRAHRNLVKQGHGIVVRDAYHPWWVTKAVWEAAPENARRLLADPAGGSGYNRGTTVDVGVYRVSDGESCEMPAAYREMSVRAYTDFPGGTSSQRWCRDVLLEAMETEGFAALRSQSWRFDWPEGRKFPILNIEPETTTTNPSH
jgi:D-alanyl-D-alanine dipeptidase